MTILLERLLVLIVLSMIVRSSWLRDVEAHHLRIDSCFGVDCVRFMVEGC